MTRQNIGFVLGLFLFFLLLILPPAEGLSREGQNAAAVTLLMACWWISEAIPICATAFVPLFLFPVLGVLDAKGVAANFGHYFVVMLLCALIIAKAIENNHLHKRIALSIMKKIGVSRRRIVLSCMLSTAGLSMWLSNLAVTLMMLPIGMALLKRVGDSDEEADAKFSTALMLGVAYSASIGGVGTLVGTPPNLVFAGVLKNLFPEAPEVSFFQWMMFGVPLVAVFLPLCFFYLIGYFKVSGNLPGSKETVAEELAALGKMTVAEKRTAAVCLLTVFGWVFRKDLPIGDVTIPGWASLTGLGSMVNDATVAAMGMLLLFIIPSGRKPKEGESFSPRLMDWHSASQVPWGIIMIIAGGYCIASGFTATGLTEWIGDKLGFIGALPVVAIILLVVAMLSFLTEINSNTATSNIFLPILATMAVAGVMHPLLLMIPGAVACSCAFMLPPGTGPNSVVFASGKISMPVMAKCGFFLNVMAILLVTVVMYVIAVPVFDITNNLPAWAK
ncbi:MAG: SLC13 family permease [Verrucomicrobiota bacterium]